MTRPIKQRWIPNAIAAAVLALIVSLLTPFVSGGLALEYNRSITVVAVLCPDALTPDHANVLHYSELADRCTEPGYDLVFKLGTPGAKTNTQTNVTGPSSTEFGTVAAARFSRLDEARYDLREFIPEGYATPEVVCRAEVAIGAFTDFLPVPASHDGTITLDLTGIFSVRCYWFNVVATGLTRTTASDTLAAPAPPGGGGSLTLDAGGADAINRQIHLTAALCPDGLTRAGAATLPLAQLHRTCTAPGDGITFRLGATGGASGFHVTADSALASTSTGGVAPGAASFSGLLEQAYTVQESIPEGYATPVVFCRATAPNGTPTAFQAIPVGNDGAIGLDLNGVAVVECAWFNLVATGAVGISS